MKRRANRESASKRFSIFAFFSHFTLEQSFPPIFFVCLLVSASIRCSRKRVAAAPSSLPYCSDFTPIFFFGHFPFAQSMQKAVKRYWVSGEKKFSHHYFSSAFGDWKFSVSLYSLLSFFFTPLPYLSSPLSGPVCTVSSVVCSFNFWPIAPHGKHITRGGWRGANMIRSGLKAL